LDAANRQLAAAQDFDPDNAVVYYFRGVLRIAQAEAAAEWPDAMRVTSTRLVIHTDGPPPEGFAKTKSRYELDAIHEFERALELASILDADAPLVPIHSVVRVPYPLTDPVAPPAVRDLLDALWADNFEGKAHGLLVYLCLDHGRTEEAEYHVEEAAARGVPVPYGYRLVGEQYEEYGRSTDALRAYLKAMNQGDGLATPGATAVDNLRKAFDDLVRIESSP
jgi:tetratricopeptide (TPR) repeat protein